MKFIFNNSVTCSNTAISKKSRFVKIRFQLFYYIKFHHMINLVTTKTADCKKKKNNCPDNICKKNYVKGCFSVIWFNLRELRAQKKSTLTNTGRLT